MLPGEKYGTIALDSREEIVFFKRIGILEDTVEIDDIVLPYTLTRDQSSAAVNKLAPRNMSAALFVTSCIWNSELNARDGIERSQSQSMFIPGQELESPAEQPML